MPPIATARGTLRTASRAAAIVSLAAELFQRCLERRRVVELLGLPLAERAAQAAGHDLERKVLRRLRSAQAREAAVQVDDLHHVAQLRLELRVVDVLQRLAALAHPE